MVENSMQCPLCRASRIGSFYEAFRCVSCELVFKGQYLPAEQEKARYEQHNNDLSDARYLKYLNQLWSLKPIGEYESVLDFGCGPTQGLQALVPDMKITSYDAFFYPQTLAQYDLVFCCEVVEHFNNPNKSWKLLSEITKKTLLVRTELYSEDQYPSWYYKEDPTHVCFYNYKTLDAICELFAFELIESKDDNKFMFNKL